MKRLFSTRHFVAVMPILLAAPILLIAEPSADTSYSQGNVFATLGFGFLLGLKHALDADHLVAVSAIVSDKNSSKGAALVGLTWGLGHMAALLAAGVAVIVLRLQIPPRLAPILELGVALMIIGLGLNLLIRVFRHGGAKLHLHEHQHGELRHQHPHLHYGDRHGERDREHHWVRSGRRPFLVGMMHGLAGSATLTLLVLAELPSPFLGLAYLMLFGLGSVGGMLTISTLLSLPYEALKRRFGRFDLSLRITASACSVIFGIYMFYEIVIIQELVP